MLIRFTVRIYASHIHKQIRSDKKFKASKGWFFEFKKRWNLSTVRCTLSRVATKIYSEENINLFLHLWRFKTPIFYNICI